MRPDRQDYEGTGVTARVARELQVPRIAFAGFGPVGATALLIVFGILNTLTIAALVEAITRDGEMRYGDAFLGRLIGDYLGRPGLAVSIPTVLVLDIVGFSVALIGFGTTVGGVTGMRSPGSRRGAAADDARGWCR
jgi:amino acid permease